MSKGLAEGTQVVKGGVRLAFQDWSCCGVLGDRVKLIWGPWRWSRTSGIQSGRPEKSRGLINALSLYMTLECLINLWPASSKILEQFPSLFFSLIHTHRNIHRSPKVNSPDSNFIEPCKQDCVFGFCLLRCRILSNYRECSPFLSLGHSDAKDKAILASVFLSLRWHLWDLA